MLDANVNRSVKDGSFDATFPEGRFKQALKVYYGAAVFNKENFVKKTQKENPIYQSYNDLHQAAQNFSTMKRQSNPDGKEDQMTSSSSLEIVSFTPTIEPSGKYFSDVSNDEVSVELEAYETIDSKEQFEVLIK